MNFRSCAAVALDWPTTALRILLEASAASRMSTRTARALWAGTARDDFTHLERAERLGVVNGITMIGLGVILAFKGRTCHQLRP